MAHSKHTQEILTALGLPTDDAFGLGIDSNRRYRRNVSRAITARRIKREARALWPIVSALAFSALLYSLTLLG